MSRSGRHHSLRRKLRCASCGRTTARVWSEEAGYGICACGGAYRPMQEAPGVAEQKRMLKAKADLARYGE